MATRRQKKKANNPDPGNPILAAIARLLGRPPRLDPVVVSERPPHDTRSMVVDSLLAAPFMQDTVRALLGGVDPRVRMALSSPGGHPNTNVELDRAVKNRAWVDPEKINLVNLSPMWFGDDLDPRSQEKVLSHEFLHVADLLRRVDPRIFAGTSYSQPPYREIKNPFNKSTLFLRWNVPEMEDRAYAFDDALELIRQGLDPDDEEAMRGVNPEVLQVMRNLRALLGELSSVAANQTSRRQTSP